MSLEYGLIAAFLLLVVVPFFMRHDRRNVGPCDGHAGATRENRFHPAQTGRPAPGAFYDLIS